MDSSEQSSHQVTHSSTGHLPVHRALARWPLKIARQVRKPYRDSPDAPCLHTVRHSVIIWEVLAPSLFVTRAGAGVGGGPRAKPHSTAPHAQPRRLHQQSSSTYDILSHPCTPAVTGTGRREPGLHLPGSNSSTVEAGALAAAAPHCKLTQRDGGSAVLHGLPTPMVFQTKSTGRLSQVSQTTDTSNTTTQTAPRTHNSLYRPQVAAASSAAIATALRRCTRGR